MNLIERKLKRFAGYGYSADYAKKMIPRYEEYINRHKSEQNLLFAIINDAERLENSLAVYRSHSDSDNALWRNAKTAYDNLCELREGLEKHMNSLNKSLEEFQACIAEAEE